MRIAGGTNNFYTLAISIRYMFYSAGNFSIKAGPAAMGFKLVVRVIERCIAPPAQVSAGFFIGVILAGKRSLCSFVQNHSFFYGRKLIVLHLKKFYRQGEMSSKYKTSHCIPLWILCTSVNCTASPSLVNLSSSSTLKECGYLELPMAKSVLT